MFKNETKIGYSLALLDIAKEEEKIKEIYQQTNVLISILEEQSEFENLLDSFSLNEEEKRSIINKTFKNVHWSLLNVIQLLSFKCQFRHFKDILKNLNKYFQEILNIQQGIVYSTKPLSSKEMKQIETKLEKEYLTKITLKNLIDKELIGGFKIKLGSVVIEDSIKNELYLIQQSLKMKKGGV